MSLVRRAPISLVRQGGQAIGAMIRRDPVGLLEQGYDRAKLGSKTLLWLLQEDHLSGQHVSITDVGMRVNAGG